MEQHSTPVRGLWQDSRPNVSSTRFRAGEPATEWQRIGNQIDAAFILRGRTS